MESEPVLRIDADFPGGNILVDRIAGDRVRLRQDWSLSAGWWFYWCFRVTGGAGRIVRFEFQDGDVFGSAGPAMSLDGRDWQWLGRQVVSENYFECRLPETGPVWFGFCPPYTQQNLDSFLDSRPDIRKEALGRTEGGRTLELLRLESRRRSRIVPLTCRTHACESVANFVLEGLIEFWRTSASAEGEFLREHIDLEILPFVDKDGVERGEQGKGRQPHDHNRDYTESPLYAVSARWIERLRQWDQKLALALDLHCPWIRGGRNDELFLVEPPEPWRAQMARFAEILERTQQGDLSYRAANNIPFGVDWNVGAPTLAEWTRRHHPVAFAATFEIAYAVAGGQLVTAHTARGFGGDLARALALFIQERRQV